jgi:hypothetical protein
MFKLHRWDAEMIIGAHTLPCKTHVWVDVKGQIVNDEPYLLNIYQMRERCLNSILGVLKLFGDIYHTKELHLVRGNIAVCSDGLLWSFRIRCRPE